MKHNAERAAILVSQAIKLCQDFALSNAKGHLIAALTEISHINKKRDRREELREQIEKQLKEKKEKDEERRKAYRQQHLKNEGEDFPVSNS